MITTSRQYLPRNFTNSTPPAGYREYSLKFVGASPQNTTGYELIVHTTSWGPYALYLQKKFQTSSTYPCGTFDVATQADNLSGVGDIVSLKTRFKVKTDNFQKRKNSGEIIMNPYEHSVTTVNVSSGSKTISQNSEGSEHNLFIRCPINQTNDVTVADGIKGTFKEYIYQGSYGSGNFFNIDGVFCYVYSLGFNFTLVKTVEQQGFPVPVGLVQSYAQHAYDSAKTQYVPDVNIQEVLGKANAGDIDALTSLAEMPETLKSIYQGFKLLLKITKDAKKGEFKILASLPDRAKTIENSLKRKALERARKNRPKLHRWLKRNPLKSTADYHKAMRDRDDHLKWLIYRSDLYKERSIMKANLEIADAVTSVWMNYRYNIKPTVMMIEDALKTVDNYQQIYRRYSGPSGGYKSTTDLFPNVTQSNSSQVLIKRSYRKETALQKFSRAATFDVFVTAYELVPIWSIVFDWFFTIGPMLRAISWNPTYDQDKSCTMYKSTAEGSFVVHIDGVKYTVSVEQRYFRRDIINPARSIGIYFKPELNWMRQLDALSFAYQAFKGNIKKQYQ